jgi:CBS-domain-containing membrane protein
VGGGLDPKATSLGTVMTSPVFTLTPSASQSDALLLMQQRNIRRIPLVEEGRLVGMVTLDDLLLDETVPLDQVAAVVESQIGGGGLAPSPRTRAAQRSAARARQCAGRARTSPAVR